MNENIIILSIDSPFQSFGGLGVSVYKMCINMSEYNFLTFGYGENHSEKNINNYKIIEKVELLEESNKEIEIIKEVIKDKKIKLIHIFDAIFIEIGKKLSTMLNIKYIFTFQLSGYQKVLDIYKAFKNIVYEKAENILKRNEKKLLEERNKEEYILETASDVIFVSEYYRNLYPSKYSEKYHVIHNGIDIDDFSKKIEKNKYEIEGNKNNFKILFIGRFDTMKNLTQLLETKIPDNIDLILAGNSSAGDLNFVEKILEQNVIKNVYHVKFLSGEKKKYYLQNVDAVIVPSIHEPFGIVTLETIASNTLLICSRSCGMKEYITEEMCINCGIYSSTISKAYEIFLSMTDIEKDKIKKKAFESIQHLTWKNNAEKYRLIYQKY